jgi:hypothetical protein
MMEAANTSETSVNFYQTTWCYNPEDSHLHTCCCENLKSFFLSFLFSGVNRNVCNKQTESEAAANIKLDPQLLQTPELERKLNTPLHMASISRTRKEYETPAHKSVYMLPATTSKKSRATDLRSLTSSLMKKKRTVEMRWQFQSVSRPYRVGIYIYCTSFTQNRGCVHLSTGP